MDVAASEFYSEKGKTYGLNFKEDSTVFEDSRFIDLSQRKLHFTNMDDYTSDKLTIWVLEDYMFYVISADHPEFNNKDKILVLHFLCESQAKLDCSGGYIMLLRGDVDQKKFDGETSYNIMLTMKLDVIFWGCSEGSTNI
jgi:hypothetical protein